MNNLIKTFKRSIYFLILIFAISLLFPEVSNSFKIVQTVDAATININLKKAILIKGDTLELKITGTKKAVNWSSSNKKVATVSKAGKVKGIRAGKATITAKVNNKKYTCKVTVESPKLNETKILIRIGYTKQLELIGNSQDVEWISSNENIATVSDDGLVTGCDIGNTTIIAKVGKKKYSCNIEIPKPYFMHSSLDIGVGESVLNILLYASNKAVYKSDDLSIATVDRYGEVTGVKEGTTTISVVSGEYTYEYPINVKVTASSIKHFLNQNYATLDTCIGKTSFTFYVMENTWSFTEYDYWIQVEYEYEFFEGAMYSNKYTDAQKNQLRQELKTHQENLAKALISIMPGKKFYGGYYDSWYKYPNLKLDLQSRMYYSWKNYDEVPYSTDVNQIYNSTKPSYFRWYDFIDDTL